MSYSIKDMAVEYIAKIVEVHQAAFPNFFLTFLGSRFLYLFYESFHANPSGICLVAVDDQTNDVLGVVAGPLEPEGYFKRLLIKKWWAFALASIKAVLRRPRIIKRLLRALIFRGEALPGNKRALLSSIAVAPRAQRKGVGRLLVNAWLERVKNHGCKGAYLTTDAADNESSNQFYQQCRWRLVDRKTTPEGREMYYYIYDFEEIE